MLRVLTILFAIFIVEAFLYNFIKPDWPHWPGDIWINKSNFRIYIPFASALLLSVVSTLLFNQLAAHI